MRSASKREKASTSRNGNRSDKEPRFDKNLDLGPLPPYGTEVYIDTCPVRLEGCTCPYCKKLVDGATRVGLDCTKPYPEPGMLSVCGYCGGLSMYDSLLKLRRIDRADRRKLLRSRPELKSLVAAMIESVNTLKRGVQ